jgi:DNA-binding IclR family transcriptional regulator
MDKSNLEERGPGALRKGLHILRLLRYADAALTPAEVAQALDIARPTAYRVLDVLEQERLIQRSTDGRSFLLHPEAGSMQDKWSAFVLQMKPVMQGIASRTGNAVFLVRQEGHELVCLHREIGSHAVQILSLQVGARSPLGVGAAGIAILSVLKPRQLHDVLERNAATYMEYGNIRPSTIRKLVENCHARGYSVVGNYMLHGVLAVGRSIPATATRPVTAISVTAPHERMPLPRQKEIAAIIHEALRAGGIEADRPARG